MTHRTGFTLLELLVAFTLLTGLATAVTGWSLTLSRQAAAAARLEQRRQEAWTAVRLLRDDLTFLVTRPGDPPIGREPGGGIRLRTGNPVPGQPAGVVAVRWLVDPRDGLVRQVGDSRRLAAPHLVGAELRVQGQEVLLTVPGDLASEGSGAREPWEFTVAGNW